MKKCKSCQEEIDDKAKKCPKCQTDLRSWFLRHPIWTGILGLILLGIVISAFSQGGDSSSNNSGNSQGKQEELAGLNTTVQDGDLAFTATEVNEASTLGNQYTRKDAQGKFKVITLKIENKGKETQTIHSSMITLNDSQGRQFDYSVDGQTAKGLSQGKIDLFLQQVQPGLSVTGDIVFDVPEDATGLVLVVRGGLFGGGKKIDLAK